MTEVEDHLKGLLLGTAVGDALGLPAEGISARRARRFFTGEWRHRFIFGHGMVSDDTELTIFAAQALLAHPDSAERFRWSLAWKLRWWLLGLPAGIGMATLRSILKLWMGISPERSGVFSAGNGPAMRSAILGACFANSPDKMRRYVEASTRLTHVDPRATTGALAVAMVAACAVRMAPGAALNASEVFALLHEAAAPGDPAWDEILQKMREAFDRGETVEQFAARMNLARGVSGYIYHTVPVAIYAWLRHFGDFRATLTAVLNCGGDTDTVGAIAGALAGGVVGETGIPAEWIVGIWDWPRGAWLLRRLAEQLVGQRTGSRMAGPIRYFWPGLILRNAIFFCATLFHGFRRLAPPY
ncbi:MAG: ADP-ribosylglycohydrolase family protein [Verrucomicrobia bacterium]|nr:ADP-ribosylglycohydrolase family protein [Verrucomicrobiota bacterium]